MFYKITNSHLTHLKYLYTTHTAIMYAQLTTYLVGLVFAYDLSWFLPSWVYGLGFAGISVVAICWPNWFPFAAQFSPEHLHYNNIIRSAHLRIPHYDHCMAVKDVKWCYQADTHINNPFNTLLLIMFNSYQIQVMELDLLLQK